jgi:NAD(P)-dependent dehydrogenase (short-subunit alcohol dehydrogenase family)
MAKSAKKSINPPQHQLRPGTEKKMHPQPVSDVGEPLAPKLANKVLFITGGDSGIGKAVSILFAKEGADVVIVYLSEDKDAADTKNIIESYGRKCLLIKGDISKEKFCQSAIRKTIKEYMKIDILVNNAALHLRPIAAALTW